jgi:hypothetical protein
MAMNFPTFATGTPRRASLNERQLADRWASGDPMRSPSRTDVPYVAGEIANAVLGIQQAEPLLTGPTVAQQLHGQ